MLLDTSFLVALERETASGQNGPARQLLPVPPRSSARHFDRERGRGPGGRGRRSHNVRLVAAVCDPGIASRTGASVRTPAASRRASAGRERCMARGYGRLAQCRHRRRRSRGVRATGRPLPSLPMTALPAPAHRMWSARGRGRWCAHEGSPAVRHPSTLSRSWTTRDRGGHVRNVLVARPRNRGHQYHVARPEGSGEGGR